MLRHLLRCLLLLMLLPTASHATHIVGGEMNYTCLGNNQYEITLTIFRDCFYGNPAAWFDDPASIGVFDVNNILLQDIRLDLMNNDTLEPVLSSICFVAPPDVCVHTTTYRDTIELMPRIGGYQLAYQRCCRNQTIVNIIDPLDSGATYGVTISERALLECNSNPKFQQWPPLYICVDEPIIFDQSAMDIDGDSIVYKLCTPLLGATPNDPMPQPPYNPPYQPINWVDPPYGVNNMLNGFAGGEPLEIDSETGLLTGLPNTVGQFVVGICVEEYRDGELISTTRRDFQYNVGVCGMAVSAFFAPEIQCESLTVEFDNDSQGADDFLWLFNDPNNPGATSTEFSPSYTFQDTGLYTIALIAEPGTICQDTAFKQVYLQYNSLFPDFWVDYLACTDSLYIQANDLTTDTISIPQDWLWELFPGGQTSTEQNPAFAITSSGDVTVRLTVTAENGCEKVFEQVLPVQLIDEELLADTVTICPGESVNLNPSVDTSYTYSWASSPWISDTSVGGPIVSPDDTTTFVVTVTDSDEFCEVERMITVAVPEPLEITLPPDDTTCERAVQLIASANRPGEYFWDTTLNFTSVLATSDTAIFIPYGETTYYVLLRDTIGCTAMDSVTITGNGVNGRILGTNVQCKQDTFGLFYFIDDPADTVTYNWYPADYIIVGEQSRSPILSYGESGTFTLYLDVENQFGCMLTDSIVLTILDTEFQPEFVAETQCSGYTVQFTGTSVNAPFYVWHFGDPDQPDAMAEGAETQYTYPGPGTYDVMVTLHPDIPCPDTLIRTITIDEPAIVLDIDWAYESCGDSAVVQFNDLSLNDQSTFTDRQWQFSNGITSSDPSPELVIYESQSVEVTLVLESSDGCVDTLMESVVFSLIEEALADTLALCPGESVELNPDFNSDYIYTWSPADGLDDANAPNPIAEPLADQLYTVVISDTSGACSIERSVFVMVAPEISYTLSDDTETCEASFELLAQSSASVIYEWSDDEDFSNILGMDSTYLADLNDLDTFYLRITDAFGCMVTDEVVIDFQGIDVFLNGAQTICIGDTARLEVANRTDDPISINWSPEEGLISGQGTGVALVSPEISTIYTAQISNEFGCQLDTVLTVNIFNFVPPLDIMAEPDTLIGGGEVQLNATDDDTYTYLWMPAGPLNFFDIANPVAFIEETTDFRLQIRDQNGCVNERGLTVVVITPRCEEPYIFVPTGFTPDGDGLNDELFVRGNGIEEMYFAVYNRWGEKVFETEDQNIGWDGRYNERELSSDVFGFYLQVRCIGGGLFSKKGNITLIR